MANMTFLDSIANAQASQRKPAAQSELVFRRACLMDRTIDLLIENSNSCEFWPELYIRAQAVLATLVVATGEFCVGQRHLQNALAYATCQEFGAAAFELRMLRSQFSA